MFFPYRWHPDIIDTQMLQVGNIIIAAVPGEFTTMAGRFVEKKRIKNTYFKYLINFYFLLYSRRLKRVLENTIFDVTQGTENLKVIVAGRVIYKRVLTTTPLEGRAFHFVYIIQHVCSLFINTVDKEIKWLKIAIRFLIK